MLVDLVRQLSTLSNLRDIVVDMSRVTFKKKKEIPFSSRKVSNTV